MARNAELAAYFTHCRLQAVHTALSLRSAMTIFFKIKNFATCATFCRRCVLQRYRNRDGQCTAGVHVPGLCFRRVKVYPGAQLSCHAIFQATGLAANPCTRAEGPANLCTHAELCLTAYQAEPAFSECFFAPRSPNLTPSPSRPLPFPSPPRLLELNAGAKIAEQARTVLAACEKNPTDAIKLNYDPRNPFDLCALTFTPIYKGSKYVEDPYTAARFLPDAKGELSPLGDFVRIGSDASGLHISASQQVR